MAGAECLGMGVVESVLLCCRYHALPSASPNHGEGQPCSACGVCSWTLCWKPLSIEECNSTLLCIIWALIFIESKVTDQL